MSTYAVIKTGGKQYRVEQGQHLLVERLPVGDGEAVALETLLFVDGSDVVDGEGLAKVSVEARVVAHERGPKLRIVKFKPKRGYKRRTGHRQELTRIEVTKLEHASAAVGRSSRAAKPSAPAAATSAPATSAPDTSAHAAPAATAPAATAPETSTPATEEVQDGS